MTDPDDVDHVRRELSRELALHNRHRRSTPLKKAPIQEVPQIYGERLMIPHENRRLPSWRPLRPIRPARFEAPLEDQLNSSHTLRLQPYTWGMSLTECSQSCGTGTQEVRVFCHAGHHVVQDSFCSEAKPAEPGVQACNHQACIGRYVAVDDFININHWRDPFDTCKALCHNLNQNDNF